MCPLWRGLPSSCWGAPDSGIPASSSFPSPPPPCPGSAGTLGCRGATGTHLTKTQLLLDQFLQLLPTQSQFAALSPRIFMESADHSGQGLLQRRLHHGVQFQRPKGEGESTFPRNPDPIANPSPSFSFKWDQSLARGPQCLRTGCSETRSKLGRARA